MATVNYQIGASGDDGGEQAGVVILTNSNFNADATTEYHAFKFRSVTVPDGATIDSMYLDPTITSDTTDEPKHLIWADDSATPADLAATSNNISGRTPTTATVLWDVADLGIASGGGFASTSATPLPNLAAIMTELMASYSFAAGRDIVLIIQGNADGARDLSVKYYDAGAANGAKLQINYTEAGSGVPKQAMYYARLRNG